MKLLEKTKVVYGESSVQWFTNKLRLLSNEKKLAYNKAIITQDHQDWQIYRQRRNTFVDKLRKQKDAEFRGKLEQKRGDQAGMWKLLKTLGNKGKIWRNGF